MNHGVPLSSLMDEFGDDSIKLLDQIYVTTIKLVKEKKKVCGCFPCFSSTEETHFVETLQIRSLSILACYIF